MTQQSYPRLLLYFNYWNVSTRIWPLCCYESREVMGLKFGRSLETVGRCKYVS